MMLSPAARRHELDCRQGFTSRPGPALASVKNDRLLVARPPVLPLHVCGPFFLFFCIFKFFIQKVTGFAA